MTTEPTTITPADLRACLATYAPTITDPAAPQATLYVAARDLAALCERATAALEAAEQRAAEGAAQLATARAVLHAGRARGEADTLSPPALDGAGEVSER